MFQSSQSRAAFRAEALGAGQCDLVIRDFTYPLTLFIGGAPRVLAGEPEALAFFLSLHARMREAGLHRLTARVTAEDLPRGTRIRHWTDWYGEGPRVLRQRVASTVSYARLDNGVLRTELLEFTHLDLPQAVAA